MLQRLADTAYEEICLSGRYSYRRLAEEIDDVACANSARESDAAARSARALPRRSRESRES